MPRCGAEGVYIKRAGRFDVASARAGNAVAHRITDGKGKLVGLGDIQQLEAVSPAGIVIGIADRNGVRAVFG